MYSIFFKFLIKSLWKINISTANFRLPNLPFQSPIGSSRNFNHYPLIIHGRGTKRFQSLIGCLRNFDPQRGYLRSEYFAFQSLIGCPRNFNTWVRPSSPCPRQVSIPSREFVKFQPPGILLAAWSTELFQSLVGS